MSLVTAQFGTWRTHSKNRMRGFTLIELMVTLIIAVILTVIAVPQYSSFVQTQKTIAEITSIYNDMQLTRSEALKEGQMVSICISSNGTSCTGTNWNQGWIVYANPTAAASFTAGSSILLKAQAAFTTTDTMTTLPAPAATVVNFNRDGFAVGVASASGLLFQLHTAPVNSASTRCLWIGSIGNQIIQKAGSAAVTGQGTNKCT